MRSSQLTVNKLHDRAILFYLNALNLKINLNLKKVILGIGVQTVITYEYNSKTEKNYF